MLGLLPKLKQFSAAASFYSGRIISRGCADSRFAHVMCLQEGDSVRDMLKNEQGHYSAGKLKRITFSYGGRWKPHLGFYGIPGVNSRNV